MKNSFKGTHFLIPHIYEFCKNVKPFMAKSDLRPAMTGVYVGFSDTHITLAATDAYKLYVREVSVKPENQLIGSELIFPPALISKIAALKRPSIEFYLDGADIVCNYVESMNLSGFFKSRLIDSNYPLFYRLIPGDNPLSLTIRKNDLLRALKLILPKVDKVTKRVFLDANSTIKADSGEPVKLDGLFNGSKKFEIAFNGNFLNTVIKAAKAQEIKIQLSTESRAARIDVAPHEGVNDLFLLMPIMAY